MGPQLSAYLIALTDGFHRFTARAAGLPCRCSALRRSSGSSARTNTRVASSQQDSQDHAAHGGAGKRAACWRTQDLLPAKWPKAEAHPGGQRCAE
ncbi:MAG: hypothetical protein IPI81_01635 [Flavobacteriales bacterium]|nr:hypothetical protein [Flavobacteriales bacterium]